MFKSVFAGVAITCSCLSLAQPAPLFTTKQESLFQEAARLPIPQHDSTVITYPWMSAIVDYDNDGSLDTILYGHHSSDAYIWRGTSAAAEYLPKGSWVFGARDPVWMDVDGDGDMDGVGTEGFGIAGEVFHNDGRGNFSKGKASVSLPSREASKYVDMLDTPSHIAKPVHPLDARLRKLYFVDLNNDGVDEFIPSMTGNMPAVTKGYSGYSWVYEQQNGDWVDVTEKMGLRDGLEQLFVAEDLDMDGDMDLLDLLKENVFRNDGGVFTKLNTAPIFNGRRPYDGDGEMDLIDIDNNGFRDLVFGGDHSGVGGIFLNDGNFSFHKMEGKLVPISRRERKFADLDNDGDIDMVVATAKEMIVYHNVTPNPGMHIRFTSPNYFGTKVQVRDGQGKLVFNTQIYQSQLPGMSQVYVNSLHVGGVAGDVQVSINNSQTGAGVFEINDTALFGNNTLTIPGVMIDGGLYWVEMQPSPVVNVFTLKRVQYIRAASATEEFHGPKFQDEVLTLPRVRTPDTRMYSASLSVADRSPMTFLLFDVQSLQ